jgi:hypothetical protein
MYEKSMEELIKDTFVKIMKVLVTDGELQELHLLQRTLVANGAGMALAAFMSENVQGDELSPEVNALYNESSVAGVRIGEALANMPLDERQCQCEVCDREQLPLFVQEAGEA